MKRGLIMEVSKRKAVVLMKDGSFERVRLKKGERPVRGQEYICPTETAHEPFRRKQLLLPSFSLSLVAVIIFVLVASGLPFGQNKASAAAYVSFDINPSIEVAVDEEMNVIKVQALNKDAERLLEGSNELQEESLLIFTNSLFETLKDYGYFDTHDDLLITSSIKDDSVSAELRKRLADSIGELKTNQHLKDTNVVVSVMEASPDTRRLASENGLSMGKFLVYQEAVKKNEKLNIQQAIGLSFSSLREMSINENLVEDDKNEQALPKEETEIPLEHANHKNNNDSDQEIVTNPDTTNDQKDAVKDKDLPEEKAAATGETPTEETKDAVTSTPTDEKESQKANTAPAKDEQDKKDEKYKNESKRDTNKKYSSKNNNESSLQVNIKLHLRGWDEDDLSPRQLKLLERLQINLSNRDKDHNKRNHNHHHRDRHQKDSHGR